MAKMSYNSSEMASTASLIRSEIAKIEENLKHIDLVCENIGSLWKGQDSTIYVAKVKEKRADMSKVVDHFRGLADLLEKHAREIEKIQNDIISAGGKL